MASTTAAYPNSHVSPSRKIIVFPTSRAAVQAEATSQFKTFVIQAALDFVTLGIVLFILCMVPA
jgi:hypothetical protein